ncbi:MAG: DNA polymerase III subunit chi [Methylococcus sp.]|jgi:DNA polymerase-3 subunit chi
MTDWVDFYILPSEDPKSRRVTACKLVEKAYRQGLTLYIRTQDEEESRVIDDLLWTFRQGSFVPHEMAGPSNEDVPVVIGHGEMEGDARDVLVNLAVVVPTGYERFRRVAELVDQDEATKKAGRERYKTYQLGSLEIKTHALEKA